MTAVVSFDREQLTPVDPRLPEPGPHRERVTRRPRAPRPPGRGSLRWAWCPAFISLAVNATFLVAWWAPEFGEFAGRDALLGQLWPLASKELTSGGQAVVLAQVGQPGLLAALLLLTSVTLPFLARSRTRLVRVLVPMATVYVGAVAWMVTLVQPLSAGSRRPWICLLLLTAWVLTAGITVWRSRSVPAADLPERQPPLGWLVAVVVLLYPVPLALGRALFAPEVADAARSLLDADPTRRFEMLATSSSLLAWLSGACVLLVGWALYRLLPPYAEMSVAWVLRPGAVDPVVVRIAAAAVCVAALLLVASPAADLGRTQAKRWVSGNPTGDNLSCATWVEERPGRPAATLTSRGDQCRELVSYAGYTESGRSVLLTTLSPVKATMPDQRPITSRVVGARYGGVVVLAGSDALDFAPDELSAISLDNAQRVWRFRCDDDGTMRIRFAGAAPVPGASSAARLAAGHVTQTGEDPRVVVECSNQSVRLDPATGHQTS